MNTSIINYELLWHYIVESAKKLGAKSTRPVLLLYYVMRSKGCPKTEKLAIFSSLAYLVLPIDILDAKRIPIIGWMDEVVALSVAVQRVGRYITPEMERKADEQLAKWFPEYTHFEMIEG